MNNFLPRAARSASPWLLAGFLALMTSGHALAADALPKVPADPVDQQLQSVCAAEAATAALPDTPATTERIDALQQRSDPEALALACRLWWAAQRLAGGDPVRRLHWQVIVAGSLVWLNRPSEARPIAEAAYWQLAAADPPQPTEASQAASLVMVTLFQQGDSAGHLEWSARSLEWAAKPGSSIDAHSYARMQLAHGIALSDARRFDEAQSLLQRVLQQHEGQLPEFADEVAAVLRALSINLRRLDRYAEGLQYIEREIGLRRQHVPSKPLEVAVALQNRAVLQIQLARFDAAEASLREGMAEAERGDADLFSHRSTMLEALTRLLLVRGRLDEAAQVAQRAVALIDGSPVAGSLRSARPLRSVANVQLAVGDLPAALATLRRALALLDAKPGTGDFDTELRLRLAWVRLQLELGDPAEARAGLQRLAQRQPAKSPLAPSERAAVSMLEAAVALKLAEPAAAQAAWRAADGALGQLFDDKHPERLLVRAEQCQHQQAEACEALLAAWQAGAAMSPEVQARVLSALAQHRLRRDGAQEAERWSQRAMGAAIVSSRARLQWQAYADHAAVLAAQQRMLEAVFFGKQALQLLQRQRAQLSRLGNAAEELYLADKTQLYRRVSDWLLAEQRVPEALQVMRLLKRSEGEDFNERAAADGQAAQLSLTPLEQSLQQAFEAAALGETEVLQEIDRLRRLQAARRITPEEQARLSQLSATQEADREQRQQRLEAALADLHQRASAARRQPAPRMVPPRPIEPDSLHAYLLAGEQRLSVLTIGAGGQRVSSVALPSAELARRIAGLLGKVQQRAPLHEEAQALYRDIALPIDRAAKAQHARRVVLWLDGPLRYLPFGMLHDGQRYLAQKYVLALAAPVLDASAVARPGGEEAAGSDTVRTSAAAGAAAGTAGAIAAPHRLHAFGVTRAMGGLPALPGVGEEFCGIVGGPLRGLDPQTAGCAGAVGLAADGPGALGQGVLPGEGDVNEYFTEAALRAAGAAADALAALRPILPANVQSKPSSQMTRPTRLLHVGTHFVLRPGNVAKSWLMTGDGGRLSLERMRKLPLGRPALVTLSACETAVAGDHGDGREIDGLAATLLGNGAQRVVASLWRVDDRATSKLMQRFYAEIGRQPQDFAGALQRAQQALLATPAAAHPYHWAAFTLAEAQR